MNQINVDDTVIVVNTLWRNKIGKVVVIDKVVDLIVVEFTNTNVRRVPFHRNDLMIVNDSK